jgi:ferredoxin-NADP reductase
MTRAQGDAPIGPASMLDVYVASRMPLAQDVVLLELMPSSGTPLPAWQPGAHIDLHLPSGLARQYSLCGDPGALGSYMIAVQRAVDGRGGSAEAHTLEPGDRVACSQPRNHFPLVAAASYLFIAGGIGVTPIVSMIREAQSRRADWRLVYGARSRSCMPFADELVGLDSGRVKLVPQDVRGLIDLASLLGSCARARGTAVYTCGPGPMLDAIARQCAIRPGEIELHTERFAASQGPSTANLQSFEVELAKSGITLIVPPDKSILQMVLTVIGDVPYACEEGICGTCETRVLSGLPQHNDDVLSEDERAANETMMICVGRALSPRLILDL